MSAPNPYPPTCCICGGDARVCGHLTPAEACARDEALDAKLDALDKRLANLRADRLDAIERRTRAEFDYLLHAASGCALLRRQGD